jgi:hypothetical protein
MLMMYLVYVCFIKLRQTIKTIKLSKKQIEAEDKMMRTLSDNEDYSDKDAVEGILLAFRFFDADGSNSINLCEFHEVCDMVGVALTKLERRALCRFVEQEAQSREADIGTVAEELEAIGVDISQPVKSDETFAQAVLKVRNSRGCLDRCACAMAQY